MTYTKLISEIQDLPYEEKENLRDILEKYLIDERRDDIYKNFQDASQELSEGKVKFTDDIDALKKMVKDDKD
ncbi:MAG: hypothetical protein ABIY50_04810 [Ignavibacteria bacterium]